MKKIILILLIALSVHADVKSTYEDALGYIQEMIDIDNNQTNTLAQRTYRFYNDLNIAQKQAKVKEVFTNSKEKVKELAVNGLIQIHCSEELTPKDKEECLYWSHQAKNKSADIEKLKRVTYQLKIVNEDNTTAVGRAVALSRTGKLVTAYHNIESAKSIVAVGYKGLIHDVTLGKISSQNDLAYIYADVKNADFVKISSQSNKIGDKVYVLNAVNILDEGTVSKVKDDGFIVAAQTQKTVSGNGVFNAHNELLAIALHKDVLANTSFSVSVNMFENIKDEYQMKSKLLNFDSSDYDTSSCENEDYLSTWSKHAKSSDLYLQELHALFIGLCQKINNRDLTTDEAHIIFQSSYKRLLSK